METYKLVPQFRDGCIVKGKKEFLLDLKAGDTIFLISNLSAKQFSFISKIESIEYSEEPQIFIDQRILGPLIENDEVIILKYNPAEAKEIFMSIPEDLAVITDGDWTESIKPSINAQLLDYGKELTFMVSWEGGAPIIGTGVVNKTMPTPPVLIGEKTKIFLKKTSIEELNTISVENLKLQEDRVEILENQIKENTINLLAEIKQGNYPNKGQKYQFSATNSKQLFSSVLTLFKGLSLIEKPIERSFGDNNEEYLGTAVYYIKHESGSFQFIDIQIPSSKESGMLVLWITGENESVISNLVEKYDEKISELTKDLKQKVEMVSNQCPGCSADLPMDKIDIDGSVQCKYCRKVSKIPKSLRY